MTTTITTHHGYDRIEHRDDTGLLLCDVCATTTRAGDDGPRAVPALWTWHHPNGNLSHVCDACFLWWMKFAAEDQEPPASYHRVRESL